MNDTIIQIIFYTINEDNSLWDSMYEKAKKTINTYFKDEVLLDIHNIADFIFNNIFNKLLRGRKKRNVIFNATYGTSYKEWWYIDEQIARILWRFNFFIE
jgi:hypothetical protein